MIKISYAITVCDEFLEIQRLISILLKQKRIEDEVVVLVDLTKNTPTSELLGYLHKLSSNNSITLIEDKFQNHFADWKNRLTRGCKGDYIFQIDADEIPNELLIGNLPAILSENPDNEVYYVSRVNTVSGLTPEHIKKWNWRISKLDSMVEEKQFDLDNPQDLAEYNLLKDNNLIIDEHPKVKVKYYTPIINWADYQMRIWKNKSDIR